MHFFNFDRDVCFYTQIKTGSILNTIGILIPDLTRIVVEYTAIYRDTLKHDDPFDLEAIQDQKGREYLYRTAVAKVLLGYEGVTMKILSTPRGSGQTAMLIEFLIQKELECKQKHESFSALVLVRESDFGIAEVFHKRYNALRVAYENPEHRWMDRDTKPKCGHYGVTTRNRFEVIIAHTLYLNDYPRTLDMVLFDEYTTWLNEYGGELQQLRVKQWILATYAKMTTPASAAFIYKSFVRQGYVSSDDPVKVLTIEVPCVWYPPSAGTDSQVERLLAVEEMRRRILPECCASYLTQ